MRLFRNGNWRAGRNARRAHRMLNWLAPNVFGQLEAPQLPPEDVTGALRAMAMKGFAGEWPVLSLGGQSIALVPGLASQVDACWAVPGIDHQAKVSYLVFGVGRTPFHSLQTTPAEAVSEARRLRPMEPGERQTPSVEVAQPSLA